MNGGGEIHENKIGNIGSNNNYNTDEQEIYQTYLEENVYDPIINDFVEASGPQDFNDSRYLVEFVSFMMGNNIYARNKLSEFLSQMEVEMTASGVEYNISYTPHF